jgi:hypothetical protein
MVFIALQINLNFKGTEMNVRNLSLSLVACLSIADAAPQITLDPVIESYVPQNRIMMNAKIDSASPIQVARTYFKSSDVGDYVFVPMACNSALTSCKAVLPAPSKETASIDYLVLVVDADKKVYKTQTFTALAKDDNTLPAYQSASKEGALQVNTGLAKAPQSVVGFTDSMTIDTIESAARFGVVAGIYNSSKSGAAAAASGATSGGTVAASAATIAGLSSTTLLIGGVVAAGAGVAVAAGGGGGGGSSHHTDDHTDTPTATPEEIVGTWYLDLRCIGNSVNTFDAVILNIPNNTGYFLAEGTGSDSSGSYSITVNGNYSNQSALINYTVDSTSDTSGNYLGRDTFSNIPVGTINGYYDTGFVAGASSGDHCEAEGRFYQK